MKFIIKHEIKGRIRFHAVRKTENMTNKEAEALCWFLEKQQGVTKVKIYEHTGDAAIWYTGDREILICLLKGFHFEKAEVPENILSASGRTLNSFYKDKLIMKTLLHYGGRMLLPFMVRRIWISLKALQYIGKGIRCLAHRRMEVAVLDATAIGVSVFRGDLNTAGSVMFLLGVGELLEEWTHKKSVGDLARSMSLNVQKVWLKRGESEILIPASDIALGDTVVVHMGNVVPFDGEVAAGEGMVNQASLTGEALPVRKTEGQSVFAGTVLEEGELEIRVRAVSGTNRFEKIVTMIEDSEKLKSALESRAEHLADQLVPYTLLGTGLVGLITGNAAKALSVLMVDFSCALKLAMPITVLSAIRQAGSAGIAVKGGKYLEAVAEADTVVFDKTGTLTKAQPTVKEIFVFGDYTEPEALRIAACLEEHFPHSMAKAIVDAARKRQLDHEEMHSKVEYIVAHGISSYIEDKKVVIGSYHFVFEDEKCQIRPDRQELFQQIPEEYSHLYLAVDGELAAVICIDDPLRKEAAEVIQMLRKEGVSKIVMMTGDSERTAASIARRAGVDEYDSEVLPEDKAEFVEKEKRAGRKVLMIGDGINDSPALSAADAGIAVSDGAELAREVADITIAAEDLYELIRLKRLADAMMKRIHKNYKGIIGINGVLILLGIAGWIQPTTSALLHNMSTLTISLASMGPLLPENEYDDAV